MLLIFSVLWITLEVLAARGRRAASAILFMVDDDCVDVLSVVPSRNFKSISSFESKHLSYCSVNSKILIWDAYMPDRNHPERIFMGKYKKVFAVMTDQPFNYMAYVTNKRYELVESEHGGSVYRLCWHTPQCMLFVPEKVLQGDSQRQSA